MMNPKMMRRPEAEPFNESIVKQLKNLVESGEGEFLEFKRRATYPDKIVRELVAFANSKGGKLLVGVSDEGHLSGLKFPDEDAFAIRKAIKKFCRPFLKYRERLIPISATKFILVYEIESSKRKPHFVQLQSRRQSYIRVADRSVKASHEMQEIIKRKQASHGVQFTYGDPERALLQYLNTNSTISLSQFAHLCGINHYTASEKLISLVLANVLRITPHEQGDLYSLVHSKN